MADHENDDVMFNTLTKSQRKQPNQEVNELIYDGESYTDNLLLIWTMRFSSLAQPQEYANFDNEFQQKAKKDVEHIEIRYPLQFLKYKKP